LSRQRHFPPPFAAAAASVRPGAEKRLHFDGNHSDLTRGGIFSPRRFAFTVWTLTG
jgi:hypothetical protein